MEKSGCILLTKSQLDLIRSGVFPESLEAEQTWGISTFEDLKAMVDSGQYRIVEQN
jgi:hypothetical protein